MRFNRPLPILLIVWSTLWALFDAASGYPNLNYVIIFVLGSFLMRTAGCIFNDIADRKYDKLVKRTENRPITSGQISVKTAIILALIIVIICFFIVLMLNLLTILLSFVAMALALSYPLFKRFFAMPQLILGMAFNFGVLMAYTAVQNTIPATAWLLYIGAIFWTIAYDTMYALADLPDDQKLGLFSSARTFGAKTFMAIALLQLFMLLSLGLLGFIKDYNWCFYATLAISVALFIQQAKDYRKKTITDCIRAFSDNHWVGLLIFIGIVFQYLPLS